LKIDERASLPSIRRYPCTRLDQAFQQAQALRSLFME